MNRRQFATAGLGAAAGLSGGLTVEAAQEQSFYELRTYELRRDLDTSKIHSFFERFYLPMLRKQTSGPVGCFEVSSGQNAPALITLLQYDSPARVSANTDLVASGAEGVEQWKAFETDRQMPYVRYESRLLKAFRAHPIIEKPAQAREGNNIFEIRTYESKDAVASAAKIEMFNLEEIKIFRDCNMHPVFFGEGLVGTRLPHLTYMLAFEDMAARDRAWGTFVSNPDWNRIKDEPKWLNTVSVIHASFLRPTPYSEIL
jgi:hypothetical protein